MLFDDYINTGMVYHVADINDLKNILEKGIVYNDKSTYIDKYLSFHKFLDSFRPDHIPDWVIREKAIFSSLNFSKAHYFHSHSVILGIRIDPNRCWIFNENLANSLYEPFVLREIKDFYMARDYLEVIGKDIGRKYWETSLPFLENLKIRQDKKEAYDGEVLIFHSVQPRDILPLYIISDHRMMSIEEWKTFFKGESKNENRKTSK